MSNNTNSRISQTSHLQAEIKRLQDAQASTITLLKQVSTQVGTHWGEQIAEHIATLQGQKFNGKEWDLTDTNGEQGR